MSDIKLKPCPFCGGEVELWAIASEPFPPAYKVDISKITEESQDVCFIHCPTCKSNFHKEMRIESFPLDTVEWWNTREPIEEIIERLEMLRKVTDTDETYIQEIINSPLKLAEAIEIVKEEFE